MVKTEIALINHLYYANINARKFHALQNSIDVVIFSNKQDRKGFFTVKKRLSMKGPKRKIKKKKLFRHQKIINLTKLHH